MSMVKATWVLVRNIILEVGCEKKVVNLLNKQNFPTRHEAETMRCTEQTRILKEIKACYGVAPSSDDVITIGDTIVNRRDIAAVNYKVRFGRDAVDGDPGDTTTATTGCTEIPGARCVTDDEDDSTNE